MTTKHRPSIPNPQSPIPNPQSPIPNPQPPTANPQWFTLLCGPLALVLVLLTLVLGQQRPAPVPSNTWDQLKVRDLRIVDDAGRSLMVLSRDELGSPVLVGFDTEQRPRFCLRLDPQVDEGRPTLIFYNSGRRRSCWLNTTELNIHRTTVRELREDRHRRLDYPMLRSIDP